MQKTASLKWNFLMNTILTVSSFIFPLITFQYASRVILPTGIGKVQLATSFVAYFTMISQLGIPIYGIRACAKVRDDPAELSCVARELLMISGLMTVLAYAVLGICIACIPRVHGERPLYILMSSSILLTALGMEWLSKGIEAYTFITVRSLVFKVIALAALFLLVRDEGDYLFYGLVCVIASSGSFIWNFLAVQKHLRVKPKRKYDLSRHKKPILIFFAMTCATTIYTNLDNVMLGFMTNDASVGIYSAAVNIRNILVAVVTSLGAVLLPRASYYIEHKKNAEFYEISAKACHFVVLLAVPLWVYFTLYARLGILFLSGEAYLQATTSIRLLMPTLLMIGLTNIMGIQMLVPLGREKAVLYSVLAGAVTDLILNTALIPVYREVGAAIGTLAAEIVVFIFQYRILSDSLSAVFRKTAYWKILIALVIASLTSFRLASLSYSYLLLLVLTAVVFMAAYGAVLWILKEPLALEIIDSARQFVRQHTKR